MFVPWKQCFSALEALFFIENIIFFISLELSWHIQLPLTIKKNHCKVYFWHNFALLPTKSIMLLWIAQLLPSVLEVITFLSSISTVENKQQIFA
jgi:hypothetical protein